MSILIRAPQPPPPLNSGTHRVRASQEDVEALEARDYKNIENPSLLRFLVDMKGEECDNKQMRDDLITMLIAGTLGGSELQKAPNLKLPPASVKFEYNVAILYRSSGIQCAHFEGAVWDANSLIQIQVDSDIQ